jgi:hypothetical protein
MDIGALPHQTVRPASHRFYTTTSDPSKYNPSFLLWRCSATVFQLTGKVFRGLCVLFKKKKLRNHWRSLESENDPKILKQEQARKQAGVESTTKSQSFLSGYFFFLLIPHSGSSRYYPLKKHHHTAKAFINKTWKNEKEKYLLSAPN